MKTFEDFLEEYTALISELDDYDKASNLIHKENFDYKVTVNLGKKINLLAKKMISIDIDKFIKLLEHKNLAVRENAAEYLYPLYPNKCLNIMEEYLSSIENDVDKIKIESKIIGLKREDAFFVNLYKKLYQVDDISKLNRE